MSHKIPYLLSLLLFVILSSCSKMEKRRILIVQSYEDSYAAYSDFDKMLVKQFKKEHIEADIRTLYLDCESYLEGPELKRLSLLLDSVSKGWKPDVLLVNEDQATYTLLKCGHPIVEEVPIVFAGVNYPNWQLFKQFPNLTGFYDKIAFKENINVAKTVFGESVRLFTVLDKTYLDRQIIADAKEQLKGEKVFGLVDDLPKTKEQQRLLEKEGYTRFASIQLRTSDTNNGGTVIWELSKYFRHQCYIQLKRDFTTVNIGNITASPSITGINEAFGYNERLLGGYITSLPIQIEEEVKSAVRIFKGTRPKDIPIVESRKEYVVDWEVMQKLGISKDKIPSNYTIIHIPLREQYPILWRISVVLIVILFVTLFAFMFVMYRREQQRKKGAQNALANEKETLALAIEGGNTYVWRLESGCFIFEEAFWKFQEVEPKYLTFNEFINFFHPSHWDEVQFCKEDLLKTRKKIVQLRCDFNGKGYQWWEFRYTTKLLPDGGYKTAGLILNVQAVKDREEELEAARLLAEKAELKQSFLANMSHEIRTPLNSIVGFSNILAVDEELELVERQEYIDTINKNSELLLKLINDILELSRIESGYMSFKYEKCLVSNLINDIYKTHQVLIMPRLEFLKESDDYCLEIDVDKDRLTQVLTNFLNNASKFTDSGYIKLGYNYLIEEAKVCIYVEDSGRGILKEEQKMIFSRFYKQNEFSQGAGLGLSICQIIIEKLRGKIELHSELGQGSRFVVILPCQLIP